MNDKECSDEDAMIVQECWPEDAMNDKEDKECGDEDVMNDKECRRDVLLLESSKNVPWMLLESCVMLVDDQEED